jgi:TRAP-type C4-dicarboxylate transport system substrate-binding protein
MRLLAILAVAASLAVAGLAACSPNRESRSADKAGALGDVVVLRLGDADNRDGGDLRLLTYLARQAEELSDGTLRIDTTYAAAGSQRPDAEQEVARRVREGELDLGYVGAEGWDELGVRSFAGLFAPLLIEDDTLLNAVAKRRLAAEMLAGLRRGGVVGLALIPRSLGPPVALERPFVEPADFAGSRIEVTPSKATDAALRALGARPVHVSEAARGRAIARGRADGVLPAFEDLPAADVVTANVSLLPKLDTLFVNPDSLHALGDDQRLALRRAATRTVGHVIATRPSAQAALEEWCSVGRGASPTGGGRAVLARSSDLAALSRATRPVYARLRRDPRTSDPLARIEALKRSLPPGPPLHLPRGCSTPRPAPTGRGAPRPPSELNGTYRWQLKLGVTTMTLRDGRWQSMQGPDRGTYTATADRISFAWPRFNSVLTFTYSAGADGTLHLTPLPSVQAGDAHVWSSQPWRRVGPPVRDIP